MSTSPEKILAFNFIPESSTDIIKQLQKLKTRRFGEECG